MNASFNEICRASVAEEQSGAGERVGKGIPQGGEAVKMKSTGKGMKLHEKQGQNNPPKRL